MVVIIRFALDRVVELERGVPARIPQTRCGMEVFWRADSDFPLLFVAAQFASMET
jgi:hypothetical protein